MSQDEQDDPNVKNEQTQTSFNTKTSDNQDQNVNTSSTKNNVLTPEEGISSEKANIAGEQNFAQVKDASDEVRKPEVTTSDPIEIDKKGVNNEQPLEDAQVENVLGDIKAQMTSAANNYAELIRLAGALTTIAASTNNPELLAAIKSVRASVDSKAKTAEQIISSDIAAENLEIQEPRKRAEQQANIARYTAIKDDFHKKLDADLALLDAAIDPSIASPGQRRILEDDLTDAEREELKRKTQLKKEGYEHVYNIKENAEKEIEQNNTKITGIDARLKATKDDNQRQSLEAEKQQYIKANETRQKELDDHVKDELTKRDKEREKLAEFTQLKERVEKYPEFSQRSVEDHFKMHAAEYDKNPDRTAINELHAMVRKVGLAEKLSVAPVAAEIEPKQAIPNINEKQEVIKQDLNKVINQVHDEYLGRPIPREATDKIANIIVNNEGYPHHIDIMKMKNIDKTEEQKLIRSIKPVPKLGQMNNTPNKPTQEQDKTR